MEITTVVSAVGSEIRFQDVRKGQLFKIPGRKGTWHRVARCLPMNRSPQFANAASIDGEMADIDDDLVVVTAGTVSCGQQS